MEGLDPFWLDTIRDAFVRTLTQGYLNVRPWVIGLMTTTIGIALFFGVVLAWMTSFSPVALVRISDVILRLAALWALANNWNWLFDGFMNSVVYLGLQIGGSTLSNEEFLAPGNILLLGIRLSTNFYLILMNMADDIWYAPMLFVVYFGVWLLMLVVFTVLALAVLTAQIEFLYISVYAFLMWPLMPIAFTAWISEGLVKLLIAAALRLAGLAGLLSVVLPFVIDLGVPGAEEPSVQQSISLGIGMGIMGYVIWQGPKMFGGSAWPGSGLVTLGMLTWVGLRRR